MNLVEYQIVLGVRRKMPIDVEPPPGVVTEDGEHQPRVDVADLDVTDEAHAATVSAISNKLADVIADRTDDEHNHIADTLYLFGQKFAEDNPDLVVEFSHASNLAPLERIV